MDVSWGIGCNQWDFFYSVRNIGANRKKTEIVPIRRRVSGVISCPACSCRGGIRVTKRREVSQEFRRRIVIAVHQYSKDEVITGLKCRLARIIWSIWNGEGPDKVCAVNERLGNGRMGLRNGREEEERARPNGERERYKPTDGH